MSKRRLIGEAPDSEAPETRPKTSAARGLLIGGAIAAAFWAAVAAVVAASRP